MNRISVRFFETDCRFFYVLKLFEAWLLSLLLNLPVGCNPLLHTATPPQHTALKVIRMYNYHQYFYWRIYFSVRKITLLRIWSSLSRETCYLVPKLQFGGFYCSLGTVYAELNKRFLDSHTVRSIKPYQNPVHKHTGLR